MQLKVRFLFSYFANYYSSELRGAGGNRAVVKQKKSNTKLVIESGAGLRHYTVDAPTLRF